ncbi:hypothetical protein, partial [Candidatus Protofrankia datiscae]|uniref:hypothetical protein n=1 Tax=Candidatus Protofrankia datiscae TaxID=2716812 RepID=UPI0019D11396
FAAAGGVTMPAGSRHDAGQPFRPARCRSRPGGAVGQAARGPAESCAGRVVAVRQVTAVRQVSGRNSTPQASPAGTRGHTYREEIGN